MKLPDLGEPWVVKREIAIIVLLYGTGLRISEALNLKVSDINNESLIVTGKGNKTKAGIHSSSSKKVYTRIHKSCPYLSINNETQYLFVRVRGKNWEELTLLIVYKK